MSFRRSATIAVAAVIATTAAPAAAAPVLPDPAQRTLTVATYNIHHGAGMDGQLDLERIATVLEATDADLIGLQEVDNHWGERSDLQDQTAWLADRLNMHSCYSANLDRDPLPGQTERQQYGTAILSVYPLDDCQNTALPNHAGGEQRGLAQADVKVRGVDVRFFNTHLTHTSSQGRAEQAVAMNEIIEQADDEGMQSVLVGDLNATPQSSEYTLFNELLHDVWPVVGNGPGYTIDPENPNRRIDYILVSEQITPRSATVIDTLASDHLPVVSEIALPHPGQVKGGR